MPGHTLEKNLRWGVFTRFSTYLPVIGRWR